MNPFQRLGVKISNWWRGEPQNDGGKMTLNSPSFLERIGLKRKGKPTSEVTYFTCLKMLSETLAKMPIKYYQKTDKGIIEAEATDTSKLLSKRPNPFMTPTTFWNTVEINRNHYGNGYVYMRKKFDRKKFGGEIKIVDLWVMQSNCVQIVVDDAGIFLKDGIRTRSGDRCIVKNQIGVQFQMVIATFELATHQRVRRRCTVRNWRKRFAPVILDSVVQIRWYYDKSDRVRNQRQQPHGRRRGG